MKTIHTDAAPKAIGPYAQAVAAGNLVFCSGQLPVCPTSGQIVPGGITEQTRQVLANLGAVLAAADCTIAHVVKTTVFLQDMNDFGHMNAEYERFFGTHKPARATVQVARLPKDARVEIDCIAARE